jgi:hypothetical protein
LTITVYIAYSRIEEERDCWRRQNCLNRQRVLRQAELNTGREDGGMQNCADNKDNRMQKGKTGSGDGGRKNE